MREKRLSNALIFSGVIFLVACSSPADIAVEPSITPTTAAATEADSPTQEITRRTTPLAVCTPPPCSEDQAYFCPDECPGGCGTVCATHTPAPGEIDAVDTDHAGDQVLKATAVQSFPDTAAYTWQPMMTGLEKPLALVHPGDGSGRLFILEQPGRIRVYDGSTLRSEPFLDITRQVVDRGNEQGLLGLAFHPDYEQNGFFFINYTGNGGDTNISRFQVSNDPNLADSSSETVLLRIPQPYQNHNGGHLLFGPDGNLYIGMGDGGLAGDPEGNAQNPQSYLGKMLRIDVDHGDPYAVPKSNPYLSGGGLPEIWALGLRNPWRYTFDRVTGDLYIADVGQNQWEEISYLAAGPDRTPPSGANFGWDYWEGTHPYEGTPPQGVPMVTPIWEYDHTLGCSITGGPVYRGVMPEWQGVYFYADFCLGTVWGLLRDADGNWRNQTLFQTGATITSFGEDESGEIYLINRNGTISRLVRSP